MIEASRSWKPLVSRLGTISPAMMIAASASVPFFQSFSMISLPARGFEVAEQAIGPDEQDCQNDEEDDRFGVEAVAIAGDQRLSDTDGHATSSSCKWSAQAAKNGRHEALHRQRNADRDLPAQKRSDQDTGEAADAGAEQESEAHD